MCMLLGTQAPLWLELQPECHWAAPTALLCSLERLFPRGERRGHAHSVGWVGWARCSPRLVVGVASGGAPQGKFAGFWRRLARQDGAFAALVKQKAHVEVPANPSSPSEWATWLNDQVDQAAKQAVRLHGIHAPSVALAEDQLARARKFMHAASRVLESGPAPRQEWKDLRRPASKGGPICQIAHEFVQVGPSRWQCKRCLRSKVAPNSTLDRKDCRTADVPPSFQRVSEFAHTHDIEWCELTPRPEAEQGDTLLFCKKCCQYATSKPLGLGMACPSYGVVGWVPGESAKHRLRRYHQGKHPRCGQDERIIAHWPLVPHVFGAGAPNA